MKRQRARGALRSIGVLPRGCGNEVCPCTVVQRDVHDDLVELVVGA